MNNNTVVVVVVESLALSSRRVDQSPVASWSPAGGGWGAAQRLRPPGGGKEWTGERLLLIHYLKTFSIRCFVGVLAA